MVLEVHNASHEPRIGGAQAIAEMNVVGDDLPERFGDVVRIERQNNGVCVELSRGGANVGTEIFPATAATTSSLGATIRSAPSFAATNAPLASVTLHATIADDAARDLRATTTGTPSSLRRTPSASAEGRSIQAIVGVEFKGVRWS